jgi:alpha-tubulin suppressor-like RCC1 family protein
VLTHIAAGGWHVLAIDDEGSVLAFGLNNYGQCGTGEDSDLETPVAQPFVISEL